MALNVGSIFDKVGDVISGTASTIFDPQVIEAAANTFERYQQYQDARDIADAQAEKAKAQARLEEANTRAQIQILKERPELALFLQQDPATGSSGAAALLRAGLGIGSPAAGEGGTIVAPSAQRESDQLGLILVIAAVLLLGDF